jgi:MFS transporter, SP family, galactose:H+ symporter
MDYSEKPRLIIYFVSSIAAIAGLLFGFDTGIISGALLFIEKDFPLTVEAKELVVSCVLLGAMVGSLCCGHLTDRFGRRRILLIISVLFIVGTLVVSFAASTLIIVIGRLFIGMALGISSYAAPLYIAEVAPMELRGGLVSLNQLAITLGIMGAYLLDYRFTNMDSASWRWMFAIGLLPALLLCIGMTFLPESPRWLIRQGRKSEAKSVLSYLRGTYNVDTEVNEIERSLRVRKAKFLEIFSPRIRPILFLGIMMGFLQQITGISTMVYYAPTIFHLAGLQSVSSSVLATVGLGVVNVLATIFAVYSLDKLGRRPLLLTGLLGMCLALMGLSLAFRMGIQGGVLRYAAVGCAFVYIICFAFSLGAMLWLLVSEIFPIEIRGAAMGVSVFSCWFWNFIVSSTFLTLLTALGPSNSFLLYAIMCVIGLVFCYYKVPETKGVTLEQIEKNINKGLPLRELGQPVSTGAIPLKTSELTS